jgi:hypothetical protein
MKTCLTAVGMCLVLMLLVGVAVSQSPVPEQLALEREKLALEREKLQYEQQREV